MLEELDDKVESWAEFVASIGNGSTVMVTYSSYSRVGYPLSARWACLECSLISVAKSKLDWNVSSIDFSNAQNTKHLQECILVGQMSWAMTTRANGHRPTSNIFEIWKLGPCGLDFLLAPAGGPLHILKKTINLARKEVGVSKQKTIWKRNRWWKSPKKNYVLGRWEFLRRGGMD